MLLHRFHTARNEEHASTGIYAHADVLTVDISAVFHRLYLRQKKRAT